MTKGLLIDCADGAKEAKTMRTAVANLAFLSLFLLGGGAERADGGPPAPLSPEDNLIHACEGPGGLLRLIASPGDCRAREAPLSWERLGGLRVLDATGRVLGRLFGFHHNGPSVHHDATGVRFAIDRFTGELRGSVLSLFFGEPDCVGTPYIALWRGTGGSGALFPDPRNADVALLSTDREAELVQDGSVFTSALGCQNRNIHPGPYREVEPFSGDLGFDFPIAAPLRVATSHVPEAGIGELIEACAGRFGALRRVEPGAGCLSSETRAAWLELGGLRVFDGRGREIGLSMNGWYDGSEIQVPAADVWFSVSQKTGVFHGAEPVFYTERGCRGDRFTALTGAAGQLLRDPLGGDFIVNRGPITDEVAVASYAWLKDLGCVESPDTVRNVVAVEPFDGELGFDFPLVVPLVPGFPGSPVANPGSAAPGTGVFHACASPSGPLRALRDRARCRGTDLSWEMRGGLRVFDAMGRDLGAYVNWVYGKSAKARVALDDASGLRFAIDEVTGELGGEPFASSSLYFEHDDCTGRAFRSGSGHVEVVGLVIASSPAGSPTGLYVGTRLVEGGIVRSRGSSSSTGESNCYLLPDRPRVLGFSTEFEPFVDELPFALPVQTPLRIDGVLERVD